MKPYPKNWKVKKFGEVVKHESTRVDPQTMPHLPFVGMDDIETQTMKLLGTKESSEMKSSAAYFNAGDVLYGKLRPYLNKVYCADFEGLCSAEFLIFKKQDTLDSKFLQYFLNRWRFVSEVNKLNTGDRPRVKYEQLASFEFPLPPVDEQKRIVEKIEELFSVAENIDKTIIQMDKQLTTYKKSVLNAYFSTKGFGKHNWKEIRLIDVIDVASGQTPNGITTINSDGDIPWYKVGDMNNANSGKYMGISNNNFSKTTIEKFKLRLLPENTIIFPKRGGAIATNKKRMLLSKAAIDLNTMAFIPKNIYPEYLWVWLQSVNLINWSNGSNVPQINHKDIEKLSIPLPEKMGEQEQVADEVNKSLTLIEKQMFDFLIVKSKLSSFKQSVLEKAFSGRLLN